MFCLGAPSLLIQGNTALRFGLAAGSLGMFDPASAWTRTHSRILLDFANRRTPFESSGASVIHPIPPSDLSILDYPFNTCLSAADSQLLLLHTLLICA